MQRPSECLPTTPCGRCEFCSFARLFAGYVSAYPSATIHDGSLMSYWGMLRQFEADVVAEAFREARKQSPQWMPTAPTIEAIAATEAKRRRGSHSGQAHLLVSHDDHNHGLDDNHPAILLAREFEVQSAYLGLDPERATPIDVAHERARKIQALFGFSIPVRA